METRDVNSILVNQDLSIKEAMKTIDNGSMRLAIIVDESSKLVGMVTDGDIRRGILNGIDIQEKVSEVMNDSPLYALTGSPEQEIIDKFKQRDIIGLPLVDENKIVKDFVVMSEGTSIDHFSKNNPTRKQIHRVLVIGGGGYIGSILVRKLLAKGYKVNVLDNFLYGKEPLQDIESDNLKILEGDTRHIEKITSVIRDADAVVHLAELVGDPLCALNPSVTQEINLFAVKTVAAICKHFQINRMVYASSCSVYGASEDDELLTENSSLNPVSLYAKMKIASEKTLMGMKDGNFKPTILRLATVFGYSPRPRFDLVVNILTAKAVREGKITVFGGDQWRPNVHVGDVANTIVAVLEAPIEDVGGEIFNVGSEENNFTINQIGEMIKENVPSAELIIEEKDVDKRNYKINFDKIKKTLNLNMMSVSDGIAEVKKVLEENTDLDHTEKKYSNYNFFKEKTD